MNTYSLGTIREFRTAQFRVIVDALPDDYLDLSFDDDGSTRAGIESGKYVAFVARCRVIHDALGEVGTDYLGGCIYESLEEFADHKECGAYNRKLADTGDTGRCGSYFACMIGEAINEARRNVAAAQSIRIRSAK